MINFCNYICIFKKYYIKFAITCKVLYIKNTNINNIQISFDRLIDN